jgi:hypothetical protein
MRGRSNCNLRENDRGKERARGVEGSGEKTKENRMEQSKD